MKVLIVEDEMHAAQQLCAMLAEISSSLEVLAILKSVKEATQWFLAHPEPDLVFMDIQLSDGICFEIFQEQEILSPIIFTTAFDNYAITAFQTNCIDYILKPYSRKDLSQALQKLNKLQERQQQAFNAAVVERLIPVFQKNYKSRFFVKSGNYMHSIQTAAIAFFFTEDISSILYTVEGKKFVVNFSLDQIETYLNPAFFFRINRQFLIHHQAIEKMEALGKGRIQIKLRYSNYSEVMVSRSRTPEFRAWLDK